MNFYCFFIALCIGTAGCAPTAIILPNAPSQEVERADDALEAVSVTGWASPQWGPLLTELNRGELLRINGDYTASTAAFVMADLHFRALEQEQKQATPQASQGDAPTYRPAAFEMLMLTNRLALNYVATGQWDFALTNFQRTHEREKSIAVALASRGKAGPEFTLDSKAMARQDRYPLDSLNDKTVTSLVNGYQTALSHYTTGFLLESRGDPLLAAQAYRIAMDLQPQVELLRQGFLGLQERALLGDKTTRAQWSDVLFIVESGSSPTRAARTVSVVVPTEDGPVTVSVAYPAISPSGNGLVDPLLHIGKYRLPLQEVVNFNRLARRALRDDMHTALSLAVNRAFANKEERDLRKKNVTGTGTGVRLLATTATSKADSLYWATLPERVHVFRGYLPLGRHRVALDDGPKTFEIDIGAPFAVVQLRRFMSGVFLSSIAQSAPSTLQTGDVGPAAAQPESSRQINQPYTPPI